MRRRVVWWTAAVAVLVGLAAGPTTSAQETEVSGQVDSIVSLSLRQVSDNRAQATVSATVPRTALTLSQIGRSARTLGVYPGPVTNARVTVAVPAETGASQQTVTFGTQTP